MNRARIVVVSSGLPWPLDSGGRQRSFALMRALAAAYDVTLVCPTWHGSSGDIETVRQADIRVVPVPIPPRNLVREAAKAARARLCSAPYVMYRRHLHGPVRAALQEAIAERPAVLWFDHLDSWQYMRRIQIEGVATVLDMHNVYSLICERMAIEGAGTASGAYLAGEARLLARAERYAVGSVDLVTAVSETERRLFQQLGARSSLVVPNGIVCEQLDRLPTGRSVAAPSLLFLGSMDWSPNVAAVISFVQETLPQLRKRFPGLRLSIVGRDPPPEVLALAGRGVDVTGRVEDVRPYLEKASALIVPLESGGGTRIKILEAFAAGLPVISTPVGVEGIDATDGVHLRVAGPGAFASVVAELLASDDRGQSLATAARRLVRDRYDWRTVGEIAVDAVARLIASTSRSAGRVDPPHDGVPKTDAPELRRPA